MYPAGNYMLKFNNRNTRTMCEICSKLIHVIAGYVRYNIKFEFWFKFIYLMALNQESSYIEHLVFNFSLSF